MGYDMGDDSIDAVILHIHMGYLVTLALPRGWGSGRCGACWRWRPRGPERRVPILVKLAASQCGACLAS